MELGSTLSGYKVIFVPFANGRPAGRARYPDRVLAPDERASCGRPVGVTLDPDGSLLVADDVGDAIWRVSARDSGEDSGAWLSYLVGSARLLSG